MEIAQKKKTNHDVVDMAKLIMSVMVCAIHSLGGVEWLRPWLSLAIPLFFVFSAYFFFCKYRKKPSLSETYIPFFRRIATIYLIWFLIWLPMMLKHNGWFSDGFIRGLLILSVRIVLNSTFTGAWYLSALILGTFLICLASKWFNTEKIIIFSALIYLMNRYST